MSKTLENLIAAFNGESNANAKYIEYAKKADEEGYQGVASLFRAAAAAEEIHFKNHAEVIKKLGGTPKADIQLPKILSTKENLVDAIKGENYEHDVMYPDFLKSPRKKEIKAPLSEPSSLHWKRKPCTLNTIPPLSIPWNNGKPKRSFMFAQSVVIQ